MLHIFPRKVKEISIVNEFHSIPAKEPIKLSNIHLKQLLAILYDMDWMKFL